MYTNEKGEKLFTLEELKDSTMQANSARYKMSGCFYLALLDNFDKETADKIVQQAYFKYGHLKHPKAEIIPGSVSKICETYAPGEFPYFPASPGDIPTEVLSEDKAVIRWCTHCEGEAPCVTMWKQTGLNHEQAVQMCHNAGMGDIGYADKCNLNGYMTKTVADGDDCCEFVVERRK